MIRVRTFGLALLGVVVTIAICGCGGNSTGQNRSVGVTSSGSPVVSATTLGPTTTPQPTTLEQAIHSDLHYFTDLTKRYGISLDPITDIGYDNFEGDTNHVVYFNQTIVNGDSKEHVVKIRYQFDLDDIDWRDGPSGVPRTISETYVPQHRFEDGGGDMEFTIPARGKQTEKITWGGGSDYYSNLANVRSDILTVDELPGVDPRDSLAKISVSATMAQPPLIDGPFVRSTTLQCNITITNNDDIPHGFTGDFTVHSTHTYLGDTVADDGNFSLFNFAPLQVPPHATVYSFDLENPFDASSPAPYPITVDGAPDEVLTIKTASGIFKLEDAGDEQLPDDVVRGSFDLTGCDYKKP